MNIALQVANDDINHVRSFCRNLSADLPNNACTCMCGACISFNVTIMAHNVHARLHMLEMSKHIPAASAAMC